MSQENVELAISASEAFIAGERDAYVDDFFAEDVEVLPDASRFPEAEPFRGREKYKHFLAEIDRGWEEGASVVLNEILPVGDRVVIRLDWGGRGRASGIKSGALTEMRLFQVWNLRDGKVLRFTGGIESMPKL